MGQALGDVLGLAAGVAVSPLPIVAIILVLATPQGRLNGLLFTFGWVAGLSALGGIMLAIGGAGGSSAHNQPAAWVGALKLIMGVLLVLFGARQWRHRPKDTTQAEVASRHVQARARNGDIETITHSGRDGAGPGLAATVPALLMA